MAAYIFTKFFPHRKRETWKNVRKLINVLTPEELVEMVGEPGEGWADLQGKPLACEDSNGEVMFVVSRPLPDSLTLHARARTEMPKQFPYAENVAEDGQKLSRSAVRRVQNSLFGEAPSNIWVSTSDIDTHPITIQTRLQQIFMETVRTTSRAGKSCQILFALELVLLKWESRLSSVQNRVCRRTF